MKLSAWAESQGIAYITAWRWFKQGKLPVKATKTPSGMILVQEDKVASPGMAKTWIYCRVSSPDKRDDLRRQAERCSEFCRASGWAVEKSVTEVASGMNDNRPKLKRLLAARPQRIVVEHKDRLTRFGFGYFEQLLPMLGCELVVIHRDHEEQADLLKDLVAIVTSFCCRLYGLRRGKNKAKAVTEALK